MLKGVTVANRFCNKQSAFARLDDYEKIRDYLAEALRARDFEVQGYSQAETLLTEVFDLA
jgi:FixJ family two-component response regulator